MTDADLFHSEMISQGGRWPRDLLSETDFNANYDHILAMAEHVIGSARECVPGLPHIHFDFVFNGSFNAYAFKKGGRYFIGFNTGTRYLLFLIFFRMLSDSRLFDFIGNAAGERSDLPALTGYTPHGERMYQAGITPVRPQTQERWQYACHLFRCAILFLVGHEIAHISRGHVDYLLSKTGRGFIMEIGGDQGAGDGLIERQTLEADADRRSTLSAMVSAKDVHLSTAFDGSFADTRRSVDALLFDWSFAMNTIFRLFGDKRFNPDDFARTHYPPLPLRRFMATLAAMQFVMEEWDPTLKDTAVNALKRGALYTEMAFLTILGEERGAIGMREAFSKEGAEYHDRLVQYRVSGLKNRLAPFAYELDADQEPPPARPNLAGENK
jgi:hypothetical protein